jgi:uncharacterized protein YecT (DUF1311 family)
MKTILVALLLCAALPAASLARQDATQLLREANKEYQSGRKEAARGLYEKAAAAGDPEAHFLLTYYYNLKPGERKFHLTEAAKKGHEKALESALEELLFRAGSLKRADPQQALDLYHAARKANPKLRLYDEEKKLATMKMCAEPKGFDVRGFMEKYGLEADDDRVSTYYVWELAEEASRGGRFGKPDPGLVFNLVIRGGCVPAELESAVEETYGNWKKGTVKPFDLCEYVTSGMGQGYCAARAGEEREGERAADLKKLKAALRADQKRLFDRASGAAMKFFEANASSGVPYGGTGRAALVISSETEQKDRYAALIEKAAKGFTPPRGNLQAADRKLNGTYRELMESIGKQTDDLGTLDREEVKSAQRLWIPYRDATAKLLSSMGRTASESAWKAYLTVERTAGLKGLLKEFFDAR